MSDEQKAILTRNVLLAGAGLAIFMCLGLLFFQLFLFPNLFSAEEQGADLRITPYSTETNVNKENGNDFEIPPATPIPGVFTVGVKVEISGTGGDGLRMREGPGTDSQVLYLAREGEDCIILEGPQIDENLIWWKIQSLEEETKTGWSVQTYMTTINSN